MTNRPLEFCDLEIQRWEFLSSLKQVLEMSQNSPTKVFWVNEHSIILSERNPEFKKALKRATILLNDGIGIKIASCVLGNKIIDNLNGTDWIPSLFDSLNKEPKPYSLFVLGSKQSVIERVPSIFKARWKNIPLLYAHNGYFTDKEVIMNLIKRSKPQMLLVAMGSPLQELFIDEHWEFLQQCGVRLALGGGAVLDFLTASVPRAPLWLRNIHCEWIFRLLLEPRRMFSRYVLGSFYFLWILLRDKYSRLNAN